MSILNQSYKELAIPYFKDVFYAIDNIMQKHRIPYYLIGVNAIALQLLRDNIKPSRGTKDIDFAIMISTMAEYEKLSESFEEIGFNKVEALWTFYSPKYNVAIDILPFGEIEEQNTIPFLKRHTDLHVLGLKEVLESAVSVVIEERIAKIPPLAGMVVLKLVAWSDRPEERGDDLGDILKIIDHYFMFEFDEIVEKHHDIFPKNHDLDTLLVAAEVLGRESRFFLKKSEKLFERINGLLQENLKVITESNIAKDWAREKDWELEYAYSILATFYKGIMTE